MITRKYKAKVEEIINPLPDIYTITFSSPKKFIYNPGQFLHLALDEYDGVGQWPESRCFSMQSNPNEAQIKITYAVKGNFTNRMKNELCEGKEVWLKLPYGDIFQRGHDKNNCVFIAGGTGVTPFLSLFCNASFILYQLPKLYFGVRSKGYNVFDKELSNAKKINPQFEVMLVYQDNNGVLNIEEIYSENEYSTFFISGPPVMISSFKKFLIDRSCPEDKVITDDWE